MAHAYLVSTANQHECNGHRATSCQVDHAARDFAVIDGRPSSKGNVEGSTVGGVLNPVGSVGVQGRGKRGHGEAS